MKGYTDRIMELSPEKRRLLELLMEKRGISPLRVTQSPKESEMPVLKKAPRGSAVPLSLSQQRLWFMDRLEPGNPAYNVVAAARLMGELDVKALELSLNEVVRRHEILRTVFPLEEGKPVQKVLPHVTMRLPVVERPDGTGNPDDRSLRRLASEYARHAFRLDQGPLLRPVLLRIGERDHLLVVVMHHIISDGWSVDILFREWVAIYEAYRSGRPSPLPEPAFQYADFAVWQREYVQGEALERELNYWKERLRGAPPVLDLSTDRPRPAVMSWRGAIEPVEIDERLTEGLKRVGQLAGATLYMVLLAAYSVLLKRYTGQEDLLIGSPVAGRPQVEMESLIGCFVNTVVLRVRPEGNLPFLEYLRHVRQTALEAFDRQELPFERLVEELKPERSTSHSPLIQTMLTLHNQPMTEFRLPGLEIVPMEVDSGYTQFDVSVTFREQTGKLVGAIEYSTDLFERETIVRMAGHWRTLLEGIVADPERRIGELPLLTEAERRLQIVEWNRTETEIAEEACIHERFEEQAAKTPQATAVWYEGKAWTYGELNGRSNQLAHYLRKRGVGPEKLVGLYMERSAEMVMAILGVLKAGGAYVPLDPAYPQERLAYMAEDAGLEVLLTTSDLSWNVPGVRQVIQVDRDWPDIERESRDNPEKAAGGSNLAYVIYTSGSTGKPKGVQIAHESVVNLLESVRRNPGMNAHDVLLAVTTLSFDISVLELFLPLICGAKIILASDEMKTDPHLMLQYMKDSKVTVMQATPSMWKLLLEAGWNEKLPIKILCGGEALSEDLAQKLLARCQELWNMYGPTETTIWSLQCKIEPHHPITIGRPVDNTVVYVLDHQLQPVPIGVKGELYIGGKGVSRGYRNMPELTEERFISDPFSDTGKKIYRTGDYVRYLPDGRIEYLGRADHMVKVRGFRVETKEIERALLNHPAISEAVVDTRKDTMNENQLVAYIVSKEKSLDPESLREYLKFKLPDYMIPTVYMFLPSLPLTPNGKIDRKALPDFSDMPDMQDRDANTEIEREIADIWREVLGRKDIGMRKGFFELGGHSLLAAQMILKLQSKFQVELPLRMIYENATIEKLAQTIGRRLEENAVYSVESLPQIVEHGSDPFAPFPLTDVQQAYWVGRFLNTESGTRFSTHIYQEIDIEDLDFHRFQLAVRQLIERHAMLRAIVLPSGEQKVLNRVPPYQVPFTDLSDLTPREAKAHLQKIREDMSHQTFICDQWPLFEIRATRVTPKITRIHVSFDLLIADAFSFQILFNDLQSLYGGQALEPLRITFKDYVLAERKLRTTSLYKKSKEYWWKRLDTLPPAPQLMPSGQEPTAKRFLRRQSQLNSDLWSQLKDKARELGITPTVALLTAYAVVLSRWSSSLHFTINLTLFNRLPLHPQVEQIVGDFTSILLLEINLRDGGTLKDAAHRIQSQLIEDFDHRLVGGVEVIRTLNRRQGATGTRIMPVVFTSTIHQNEGNKRSSVFKIQDHSFGITQTSQVWLDHQVYEHDGELRFHWDAVDGLFVGNRLDEMFQYYGELIRLMATEQTTWDRDVSEWRGTHG